MDTTLNISGRVGQFGAKTKKYVDAFYLIVLTIYIAGSACILTFNPPAFCAIFMSIGSSAIMLVAIYRIVIEFFANRKRAIAAVLLIVFAVICSVFTGNSIPLSAVAFAMVGAIGVKADFVLWSGIAGNAFMIVTNLVKTFVLKPDSYMAEAQQRNFYLFGSDAFYLPVFNNNSSTDLAAHYFWIFAAFMWIRGKKITWAEILLVFTLNGVVYSLTGSGNSLLCTSMLLIFAVAVKIREKIKSSRGVKSEYSKSRIRVAVKKLIEYGFKFSYVIIATFCIVFSACFTVADPLMRNLNSALHERISYGHRGLMEYGIHLLTSDVPSYGINSSGEGFYNFIDNSYVSLLVVSGVLMLLFYLVTLTAVQIRQKKYLYGAAILAVCAFSCIEEHHLAELPYNYLVLLLFADFDADQKNDTALAPKKKSIQNVYYIVAYSMCVLLAVTAFMTNLSKIRNVNHLNLLDSRAGEIYASVQKNLDTLNANGAWKQNTDLMSSVQFGKPLVNPSDFTSVTGLRWKDVSGDPKSHSYYSVSFEGENNSASADIADLLITDETRDLIGKGSVVIEYDVSAGKVYSVWYSDKSGCKEINGGRDASRAVRLTDGVQNEGYYAGGANG